MKWEFYIFVFMATGMAAYCLTRILFKKLLGEVLYAKDENGKRHRVLKRPGESLTSAIGRLKEKMNANKCMTMKWGILFRWQSWWIGAHWSPYNKRLCVNLIPLVTIWIVAKDGIAPNQPPQPTD